MNNPDKNGPNVSIEHLQDISKNLTKAIRHILIHYQEEEARILNNMDIDNYHLHLANNIQNLLNSLAGIRIEVRDKDGDLFNLTAKEEEDNKNISNN